MLGKLIREFETNSTRVQIFKSRYHLEYFTTANAVKEDLYIIVSIEKCSGKEYARFGNYTQMKSIENTYKNKTYINEDIK